MRECNKDYCQSHWSRTCSNDYLKRSNELLCGSRRPVENLKKRLLTFKNEKEKPVGLTQ